MSNGPENRPAIEPDGADPGKSPQGQSDFPQAAGAVSNSATHSQPDPKSSSSEEPFDPNVAIEPGLPSADSVHTELSAKDREAGNAQPDGSDVSSSETGGFAEEPLAGSAAPSWREEIRALARWESAEQDLPALQPKRRQRAWSGEKSALKASGESSNLLKLPLVERV